MFSQEGEALQDILIGSRTQGQSVVETCKSQGHTLRYKPCFIVSFTLNTAITYKMNINWIEEELKLANEAINSLGNCLLR